MHEPNDQPCSAADVLGDMADARDRAGVAAALLDPTLDLDASRAEDVWAGYAYVYVRDRDDKRLGWSRPPRERAAREILEYERCRPGLFERFVGGDAGAAAALSSLVDAYSRPVRKVGRRRVSKVHAALDADDGAARAILGLDDAPTVEDGVDRADAGDEHGETGAGFWALGVDSETWMRVAALQEERPSRYSVAEPADALFSMDRFMAFSQMHEMWQSASFDFATRQPPRLRVRDPTFRPDLLKCGGFDVCSAKLRRLLGEDPRVVRYRDIDVGACVPEVRALEYSCFDVVTFGNPYDPARMSGSERDVRWMDGSVTREWVVELPAPPAWVRPVFREDFVPPAPIFRVTGTYATFVTDALAEAMQRAGVSGASFVNVAASTPAAGNRYRTLR